VGRPSGGLSLREGTQVRDYFEVIAGALGMFEQEHPKHWQLVTVFAGTD